jgi:hypothetical protein
MLFEAQSHALTGCPAGNQSVCTFGNLARHQRLKSPFINDSVEKWRNQRRNRAVYHVRNNLWGGVGAIPATVSGEVK